MSRAITLPAHKRGPFTWLWPLYLRWSLPRAFAAMYVEGDEGARPDPARPTVIYSNHCGWWDGFVAWWVATALGYDGYLPMEEVNLRRFPSFTALGAFGLDRANPRAAHRALRYAAELLHHQPGRCLWIFPQGQLLPYHAPLELERGAAWIAHEAGARLVPACLSYEVREQERPEIFVTFGEAHLPAADRDHTTREMTAALQALRERQTQAARRDQLPREAPLMRGAQGMDTWWEGVKRWGGLRGETRHSSRLDRPQKQDTSH